MKVGHYQLECVTGDFEANLKKVAAGLAKAEADGLATVTPAGIIPTAKALNTEGLSISGETLAKLLAYDPKLWAGEVDRRNEYLSQFPSMPKVLEDAHARFVEGVAKA